MRMRQRIIIAVMMIAMFAQMPAHAAADGVITDWDSLKNAIQEADNGAVLIISGQLTAESNITITDKSIKLIAADAGAAISRGSSLTGASLFTVKGDGASLTLGDSSDDSAIITLDGGSETLTWVTAPLINVFDNAQLILNSGILKNNNNVEDSSLNISANSGGGVYVGTSKTGSARDNVQTSSRFIMNGGTFENLSAARAGGGVFVHHGAIFEMNGGSFKGCNANRGKYNNNPYGGAIYSWGGKVTITNSSQFIDCTSGDVNKMGYGGAVAAVAVKESQSGSLHISGKVSFSGTQAAGGPCGIYAKQIEEVTIEGAQFSQLISAEGAIGADGVAVHVKNCGQVAIKDASFDNCKGDSDGGAVKIYSVGAILDSCTFTDCSSGRNGGALFIADNGTVVKNTTFKQCSAQTNGGAVYLDGKSQVTMEGVKIEGCSAWYGSGIYVSAAGISEEGKADADTFLTLDDQCAITQCGSAKEGGGIYIERRGQVRLNGAKITGCKADKGGGVFIHYQNDNGPKNAFLQVSGGTQITDNSSSNVYFENETQSIEVIGELTDEAKIGYTCGTYRIDRVIAQKTDGQLTETDAEKFVCDHQDWLSAVSSDGKIGLASKKFNVPWSQLAAQIAAADAGTADNPTVITVSGSFSTDAQTGTINIDNKHIRLVPADGDVKISRGSGQMASFFKIGANGSLTMGNTSKDTAHITLDGGDMEKCSPLLTLAGGDFTLNAGLLTRNHVGGSGGAVCISYANASHFIMNGGTISDCTATSYGGAVYMYKGGGISIKGGVISNCKAASMGGAVMAWDGKVDMSGGSVEGCKAANGSGIYIYTNASMTMSGGTIANCSGENGLKGVKGGGIRIHTANGLTMTGGTIVGCSAEYGGGIYTEIEQSVQLDGGTISKCQANYGGAIYAAAAQAVTMHKGTLSECTASNSGGAVYATKADNVFTMIGGTIAQCKAIYYGGAIYMGNGGVHLEGGTIDKCEAEMGGGLMAWGGVADISGGLIENCTAKVGGGIYIYEDSAVAMSGGQIIQCTALYDGGGIFYTAGTAAIAGSFTAKDNLAGTADNLASNNIYLDETCVLRVSGALTSDASIGVSCADPAAERVVAEGSDGHFLTVSDAEKFISDAKTYGIKLNDAGQAVLKKVGHYGVTVEVINGKGQGQVVYAGDGLMATVILTPEYGYKLAELLCAGDSVMSQIQYDEKDCRSAVYRFTPSAEMTVQAVFAPLTAEDMGTNIEQKLPNIEEELTEADVASILDFKADYEALSNDARKNVSKTYLYNLNQALGALSNVSVELSSDSMATDEVSVQDLNMMLTEMTLEEVKALKTGELTNYKLMVTVKPVAVSRAVP